VTLVEKVKMLNEIAQIDVELELPQVGLDGLPEHSTRYYEKLEARKAFLWDMVIRKVCSRCHRSSREVRFHKNRRMVDGLQVWCAECMKTTVKKTFKTLVVREEYDGG
jgi:hypothetical protein